MKRDIPKKCKWFGHKWEPAYIAGRYSNIEVKFIACSCERCGLGQKEILDVIKKQTANYYNTYNEKYFLKQLETNNP